MYIIWYPINIIGIPLFTGFYLLVFCWVLTPNLKPCENPGISQLLKISKKLVHWFLLPRSQSGRLLFWNEFYRAVVHVGLEFIIF